MCPVRSIVSSTHQLTDGSRAPICRCHVMERESFESQRIAQLLNERFVSIKVPTYPRVCL